jgi:hypothetical protein
MSLHSPINELTKIYVIADSRGNGQSETQASTVVGIVSDHDVLTVFTSQEILHDYTKAYFWKGPIQPVAYALDPLRLANVVAQLEATRGLRSLVFDPSAVCDGRWTEPQIRIPARAYLCYIVGLMEGAGETFAEGKKKVEEHFSGPEGRGMLLAWVAAQEKEVTANAQAQYEEWVLEDDPWSDEPYVPTGS